MRGGFVACLGGNPNALDQAVERLRWHRGKAVRCGGNGLEIAAFVDPADGPIIESTSRSTLVAHGTSPGPLAELMSNRQRFVAIEWNGNVLRAARDPLGLAPLFYRVLPGAIWFATEVAPLVSLGTPRADLDALSARAALVPMDERTGWNGIYRVVPGSTIEVSVPNFVIRSTCYWHPDRLFGTYPGNRADALADLRRLFYAAVRRCLEPRSAILFSGGVDSTCIAVSARSMGTAVPYLTHVRFPELPQSHEEHYAAAVAHAVGAPLHTVPGDLAPWDLDLELDLYGIPYNRLPYGLFEPALSHVAGMGIDVALDGHDGDGVLGPRGGEWGTLLLDGEWRRLATLSRRHKAWRALRGLAADFVPPFCRPARYRGPTYAQSMARYFHEPLRRRILADDIFKWRWPSTRWRMRQLQPLLPRALVSFEQKELEAARCGIDLRHPFADRDLVELLISLPCAIKSDPGRAKHLLVEALGSDLPEVIRERPKSDYMSCVRRRVDPARCIETILASRIRLQDIDYGRLSDDSKAGAERIPLFLAINLARVHEFARRYN